MNFENRMSLRAATKDDFDAIYDAIEDNFVPEERREREKARRIFHEEKYSVLHIMDGTEKVGFFTVWKLDVYAYVEHFVVYKEFRNRGYGGAALELLKNEYSELVLEAEPPAEGMAARRVAFYERCGFCQNEQYYMQPSYREGGDGVELVLMSYPSILSDFHGIAREIYAKVYKKKYSLM